MTDQHEALTCARAEELGAAYLLGAVEPDEARTIADHLATCREPHPELRDGVGGEVLALGLEPVAPRAEVRDRLMATIERTPQDHAAGAAAAPVPAVPAAPAAERRPAPVAVPPPARAGLFDWLSNGWARGVVAAAVVAVIALGAWNIGLQAQLRDSRAVADAIANARTVHTVASDAGRGLLLDTGSGAAFVPAKMASLSGGQVYEAWLIPADGAPVGVATFRPSDGPMLVQLDHPLTGFATFALTVERGRVEAPTGAPVMTLSLPG